MTDPEAGLGIHEVVARHGHLVDEGEFERLREVFVPDVEYDLSALGGGTLVGIEEIVDAARRLADRNPLAHLVTNVVVEALDGHHATVRSKGLAVMSDGSVGAVTYVDTLVCVEEGWRIQRRVVLPRRRPLHPSGSP